MRDRISFETVKYLELQDFVLACRRVELPLIWFWFTFQLHAPGQTAVVGEPRGIGCFTLSGLSLQQEEVATKLDSKVEDQNGAKLLPQEFQSSAFLPQNLFAPSICTASLSGPVSA